VIREVLKYPDRRLKEVCRPADRDEAQRVAEDLIDTMRSFPGCVGIAAPQIGELVRVAVVDCTDHPRAVDPNGLLVLVNPRITNAGGGEIGREGCLSIPELTANVRRATSIRVEAGEVAADSVGFEARCIQHELDHLDGVLFLDRVESLAHDLFVRQVYR
jgi:peptide deformylase